MPIYRRYTTEVKRIEELLAMRERERTELLNQYKHLNDEVETSVNYGRQLESRVSSFSIYLIQFKKCFFQIGFRPTNGNKNQRSRNKSF